MRMHAPSSSTSSSLSYTKESRVHAMFDAPLLNCIRRHSIRACVLPYIHCAPIQFASRRINQNVEPAKQQQQFETRAFAICFMGLLLRTFLIVNPVFFAHRIYIACMPKKNYIYMVLLHTVQAADKTHHTQMQTSYYIVARAHFNFCLLILVGRKHGTHCIWLTQCFHVAEADGLQYIGCLLLFMNGIEV